MSLNLDKRSTLFRTKLAPREGYRRLVAIEITMRRKQHLEQATLSDVFEREVQAVFGFLLMRCGSRAVAEDLTGETFADASRRFAEGRGDEVTAPWLRTVAKRRLMDHWRSEFRHRGRVDAARNSAERRSAPDSDPDGKIDAALDALPPRQRTALVMRYLDGFSTSEVADQLDATYKATESLLGRARRAFTEAYGEVTS